MRAAGEMRNRSGVLRSLGLAVLVFAALTAVGLTGSAQAEPVAPVGVEIRSFEASPSDTQAGGHPDVSFGFTNSSRIDPFLPGPCRCNTLKEARLSLPAGVIGDPHAVPRCTAVDFSLNRCSPDSQVGVVYVQAVLNDICCVPVENPLYNLATRPGQAGLLGFKAPGLGYPVYTIISARTGGDFGLEGEALGIHQSLAVMGFKQVLWGVPASPVHDPQRFKSTTGGQSVPGPTPSNSPEVPFLQNPTTCAGPLQSSLRLGAYDHGISTATAPWPATTGCDTLAFNPSLSAQPSTTAADTASGLDIDLQVPQNSSPSAPSASEIKATTVTLPAGFSVNPSAADGKTSCSDAEARFGTTEEAQCPEASKVGTLSLLSSALPEAIPGGIYLGEPLPGNRYRLFITADGFATHIKLPGSVYPDPQTGQLVTSFQNLPQSPLTEFKMHLFGSERGLLATPTRCGRYAVNTEFVPWAAELPNQTSTQFFSITEGPGGSPCPGTTRPFAPTFKAAGASNGAGAHSPFSVLVNRPDGDQNLLRIGAKTPPGFSATLKGVPYCPQATLDYIESPARSGVAEQASPSCPPASQVGVSSAAAGAGTHPLYAPGRVYLAGPYKGGPLSFAVVTPAVSGPYDLGNVVNRVAVDVDPESAQVTALSDPLPQIIDGIPLRLRSVLLSLDKPNFTLNPTNCDPFEVNGLLSGTEGAFTSPSNHFQVANCDSLNFEPKLRLTLSGATKRGGFPALKAVLTQPASGQANNARAAVTLPHSEFLAQGHIGTVCTRVQFAADNCPAGSIYGKASAVSPLLDGTLEGPVYLRSSSNKLPDLVVALKGPASQPVKIDLVGRIDSVKGGIRTTFDSIPDAPVSRFVLEMRGGKKGLLENSTNLCKSTNRVVAKVTGQNGAKADQNPVLEAPCGASKRKAKAKRATRKSGRAGR